MALLLAEFHIWTILIRLIRCTREKDDLDFFLYSLLLFSSSILDALRLFLSFYKNEFTVIVCSIYSFFTLDYIVIFFKTFSPSDSVIQSDFQIFRYANIIQNSVLHFKMLKLSFVVVPLKADYRPRSTSLAAKRPAEDVLQVALTEKVIEPVRTQSEATLKSPEKAQDEPRFTNKTMSFSELKELAETHTKLKEALHQQVRKETFPST